MREHYEKSGRSVRLERNAESSWVVRLDEKGIAERDHATFTARSAPAGDGPRAPTQREVERLAGRISDAVPHGIVIERMVVVAGAAAHGIRKGRARAEWSERSVRVHISLANPGEKIRTSIDLGGPFGRSISIDPVRRMGSALLRVGASRARNARLLRLEPIVAASLWSSLVAHPAMRSGARGRSALKIIQVAPDGATRDGIGDAIRRGPLFDSGEIISAWPNVFRPSYRLPPRPAPMHVRASIEGPWTDEGPVAVGLVEPPTIANDRLILTLLVEMDERARIASVDMTVRDWVERIVSIADDASWFPFSGGSWGSATTLENVRLA